MMNEFLASVRSYTLHKISRKPRRYNPFVAWRRRQTVHVDLLEIGKYGKVNLAHFNNGTRYILTAVDIYTKFAVLVPMKHKDKHCSLAAIKMLLLRLGPQTKVGTIYVDRGKEWNNSMVLEYLRDRRIKLIFAKTRTKPYAAERKNRDVQSIIMRYLTEFRTSKYLDVLDRLCESLNGRYNRSIGMSAIEAEKSVNDNILRSNTNVGYSKALRVANGVGKRRRRPPLRVGDVVRVSIPKTRFTRGYAEQYYRQLFIVVNVNESTPVTTYQVKNADTNVLLNENLYAGNLTKFIDR